MLVRACAVDFALGLIKSEDHQEEITNAYKAQWAEWGKEDEWAKYLEGTLRRVQLDWFKEGLESRGLDFAKSKDLTEEDIESMSNVCGTLFAERAAEFATEKTTEQLQQAGAQNFMNCLSASVDILQAAEVM